MTTSLQPILPTPTPRDEPDGTTAWSDEVGLPGPPRLLAWTVVQEDDADFDLHVLWDTRDIAAATDAARDHARSFFGHEFHSGTIATTVNSATNMVRTRYETARWN